MCNPVTFHGVSPAVFDCIRAKLIAAGVMFSAPDNAGTLTGHGVAASFSWDGADALTVTITGKPFFISCGHITGAIHDALVACGDQA
jgi:hypothetical protein